MQVGIMITNGGTHPPEKWAEMTAGYIMGLIQIEPSASPGYAVEKMEMNLRILKALVSAHAYVQTQERGLLDKHGADRLDHALDPTAYIGDTVSAIVACAADTSFAQHFSTPKVKTVLHNVIGQHFANEMHIERLNFTDANSTHPQCVAYRAKHGR